MAGPGTILAAGRRSVRAGLATLLLVVSLFAAPLAGRTLAQADDPGLGDAVSYYGPEGDEVATIAVAEVVDPFRDYDPNSAPERGSHFVLLRLVVENTGGRALQFDPSTVALQDTLGFLSFPRYVNRGPEATEANPDLTSGDVPAGGTVEGLVLFQVINDAELARVVYQPSRDRLVVLADLRRGADAEPAVGEPTSEPTGEPTAKPAASTPEASGEPAVGSAVYGNAAFGFGLAYDGELWDASESADGLTLSNGVSTVRVTGSDVLPTEATTCVEDVAADLALTPARQDYMLLEGNDGEPVTAGDADAAFAIFGYTDRAGEEMFEQITCVALPEERGVVLVLQDGPLAAIADEGPAAKALLNGLTFEE